MNLNHAPEIVYFPRSRKKRKNTHYDISRYGIKAEGILRWLHETSGVKVGIENFVIFYIYATSKNIYLLSGVHAFTADSSIKPSDCLNAS